MAIPKGMTGRVGQWRDIILLVMTMAGDYPNCNNQNHGGAMDYSKRNNSRGLCHGPRDHGVAMILSYPKCTNKAWPWRQPWIIPKGIAPWRAMAGPRTGRPEPRRSSRSCHGSIDPERRGLPRPAAESTASRNGESHTKR